MTRRLWILPACTLLATTASAQTTAWQESPINGHWYAATTGTMSWSQAEALAQSYTGHLVTIRSAAENSWLTSTFLASPGDLWIGMSDLQTPDVFVWSSGEPWTYANWGFMEPAFDVAYLRNTGLWYTNDASVPSPLRALIEIESDDCDMDGVPDAYEKAVGSPTCPSLLAAGATFAQSPDTISLSGDELDLVSGVSIGGQSAAVLFQSATILDVQPTAQDPGFAGLSLVYPGGVLAGPDVSMWPTLSASTTGIGGTIDVTLDNGDVGLYALAFGTGVFPAPFPIASPPTWYGVLLDITQPVFTASTGAFATPDPVALSFPVPNNPAWAGVTLYFQAWCQQEFFGLEVTASFTNTVGVTF